MRVVRPDSRRYLKAHGPGDVHRPGLDALAPMVPFVPLPGPQAAWAIMCPGGCDTELIILPDYTGAWVECPTCGFRFLGPHPAQPHLVELARAAAARAAAEERQTAGALAALARPSPGPSPSPALSPAPPAAAVAAENGPPSQDLTPDQSKALAALEAIEKASRAAGPSPAAPRTRRQIVAYVKPAAAEPVRGAGERSPPFIHGGLNKAAAAPPKAMPSAARLPARRLPAPPPAAPPAAESAPDARDLTPQESEALGALEAMARNRAATAREPTVNRRLRERMDLGPRAGRSRAARSKKRGSAAGGPWAATGSRAATAAHRVSRGDLILTWAVSLTIAAGIIAAALACGLPDIALGAVVFVGLAVVRTWVALMPPKDDL
ncbi:MAG: hypothetical protein FJ288_04870 [Planctomycetes bacterium]|nr:hypothetical protein [Planctomycetota bacterium]